MNPECTEEEATENLRNTHDEVPVRDTPKHVSAEPLAEFHNTFLMTGRKEVPPLAGENEEPFVSAPIAANPGEAIVQVTTLQVPDDDLPEIGPPEAVALPGDRQVMEYETERDLDGYVALWTKADSVTLFKELQHRPSGRSPAACPTTHPRRSLQGCRARRNRS